MKSVVTEGLVIAGVPAFGYVLAHRYESAYLATFALPSSFVEVGLGTTLFVAGSVLSSLFVLFLGANLLFAWLWASGLEHATGRSVARLAFPLMVFLAFVLLSRPKLSVALFAFGFLVFLAALELILPLLTQRRTKGYVKKLEAQEEVERGIVMFTDVAALRAGPSRSILLGLLVFIYIAASYAGEGAARSRTVFLVPVGHPTVVVIRNYGEKFICAEFDKKSKTVLGRYRVFDIGSNSIQEGLAFNLEEVGPLSLPD